jgi:hypothetical protein
MGDFFMISTERNCGNCACYWIQKNPANPLESQGFCRRNGAAYGIQEMEQVLVDLNGIPRTNKDGSPRMGMAKVPVYMYPPTLPALVCFDGWRPHNELPGSHQYSNDYVTAVFQALDKLADDMSRDMTHLLPKDQRGG